jgi:nonspecific dipeptidase
LKELGAENVELADIGEQTLPDGSKIPLPPIVFGNLGADPNKKTILVYGHLDVQPASIVPHFCYMAINFFLCFIKKKNKQSDGWDSEPFELTERDGKLYGRGSTDDKGPVLDWLNAIEAYQELKQEIPVNIKVNHSCYLP